MRLTFSLGFFSGAAEKTQNWKKVLVAAATYRTNSRIVFRTRITHTIPVAPRLEDTMHVAPLRAEQRHFLLGQFSVDPVVAAERQLRSGSCANLELSGRLCAESIERPRVPRARERASHKADEVDGCLSSGVGAK
ncbi:unnamed protein product [Penicillium glandicola]